MSYVPTDESGKATARYPRQASNAMAARLAAFQQSASDDGNVPEPLRGGALPQPRGAMAMAAASDVRRDQADRRPVTAEAVTVVSAGEHDAVRQLHQAEVARLTVMQALQQKRLAAAMAEAERASEESEQETAKATEKPASVSSFASQLAALQKEQAIQAAQLKELALGKMAFESLAALQKEHAVQAAELKELAKAMKEALEEQRSWLGVIGPVAGPKQAVDAGEAGPRGLHRTGLLESEPAQARTQSSMATRSELAWGLRADEEPRRTCLRLLDSPTVDLLVVGVILANCVLMALDVPTGVSPEFGAFVEWANNFFLGFYTLELLVRVVAQGLHCEPGGFLSNPFNIFEGSIVLISWIVLLAPSGQEQNLVRSITRSFRSLRVLLLLGNIPGMPALVDAALKAIPAVWNVSGLCVAVVIFAAVSGVQFFGGVYHFRCADEEILRYAEQHHIVLRVHGVIEHHGGGLIGPSHDDFSWQKRFDSTGKMCFGDPEHSCPEHTFCYEFEHNPDHSTSFDSVITGVVPLLQTFLLDGWAEEMYRMMEADCWESALYFVILAICGGFLVLQLFLAVISDTFAAIEEARKALEADGAASRATGDSLDDEEGRPSSEPDAAGEPQPGSAPMGGLIEPPRSLGMMTALSGRVEDLVTASAFNAVATLLVMVNVVLLAVPYHNEPIERTRWLESASKTLSLLFIGEFGLKIVGLGCRRYWQNKWNCLDGTLVLISIGELMLENVAGDTLLSPKFTSTLRLLRVIRVMRAMRVIRQWPTMYRNVVAFVNAVPQVTNLLILMGCVVFIFAIIGMQLFGLTQLSTKSHAHFEFFGVAALTVFELFATGVVDLAKQCYLAVGVTPTVLYFGPVLVIGYLGLMNLFVAILLQTFEEGGDPMDDNMESDPDAVAEAQHSKPSKLIRPNDSPLREAAAGIVSNEGFELFITFLIAISSICLVLDSPRGDPEYVCSDFAPGSGEYDECANSTLKHHLDAANVYFTLIFTFEAILKVMAYGRAYFTEIWNLVDFAIVCSSLLSLLPGFSVFQTLRVMRVLRPLRLLIRNPNMKDVIETLINTLPAVTNVLVFVMGLMAIFAIVGMQLFMGTYASCNDPAMITRAQCLADTTPPLAPLSLPSSSESGSGYAHHIEDHYIDHHRELRGGGGGGKKKVFTGGRRLWLNPDAGNFDSFSESMLALFIAMTGDNMPTLMWLGMDAVGVDVAPVRNDWSSSAFYFMAWQVVGTFMATNLFVGAIVDSFSTQRQKTDGTVLMSPGQGHWVNLMREVRHTQPLHVVRPPAQDSWFGRRIRMPMYELARSKHFEYTMYCVIAANTLLLCFDHYHIEEVAIQAYVFEALTVTFRVCYVLEFLIKIIAMGVRQYFSSESRVLEFVLLIATGLEQVDAVLSEKSYFVLPPMVLRLLRIMRVLRVIRLVGDRRLGRTRELMQTLMLAVPSLLNVTSVLFLVMSIYAVLGMQLFPFVKHGEALNDSANFESFGSAMLLLFQVLTGDDWSAVMRDAAIDRDHGCDPDAVPSDCGTPLAIPFFVSFTLVGAFIFLNLVVAVVLERFESLRGWKDESDAVEQSGKPGFITFDHVVDCQELWADYSADYVDDEGDSAIRVEDLPSFVSQLNYPLGLRVGSTVNFAGVQRLKRAAAAVIQNGGKQMETFEELADEREREAVNFCLQIKGLRAEVDNPNVLDFHDTVSALVRHSFASSNIESPVARMPEEKQNEDCETYRELSHGEVSPRLQAFRDRLRRTFGVPAAPVEAPTTHTSTASLEAPATHTSTASLEAPATHTATASLEATSFRSVVRSVVTSFRSVSSSRSHSPTLDSAAVNVPGTSVSVEHGSLSGELSGVDVFPSELVGRPSPSSGGSPFPPRLHVEQSPLVPPLHLCFLSAVPDSATNESSLPDPSLLEA